MKEILKKNKFFTPDNYEKEEQFLRNMSLKGWHFTDFSLIRYTFIKGQPKSYSYKLDFQKDINKDKENYIAMYEDCGWEHIYEFRTFGGAWEYFRKESETGYEETLFSDDESKIELLIRIRKVYILSMLFFAAINFGNTVNIINMIQHNNTIGIFVVVSFVLLVSLYTKILVRISIQIDRLKRKPLK